jgi:branched-chain amino acid transport system substrate-binding protein
MKCVLGFLAAALSVGAGAYLAQVGSAAVDDNAITIGTAGPMSGDLARFGMQMKHGAEQAVADINAQGGVLGKQLKLLVGDDHYIPDQAPDTARELADQHVVFVAGHFCSGSSIPASRVYHERGVLQITPASSNPKLTEEAAAAGWMNVFRLYVRDDQEGAIAGAWIAANAKGRNVAIDRR